MRHRVNPISPYYAVFINVTVDVCQFLNGTQNNLLVELILKLAGDSISKNFIHPCPYYGLHVANNMTMVGKNQKNELAQFPNGYYRFTAHVFNKQDDDIITFNGAGEIGDSA